MSGDAWISSRVCPGCGQLMDGRGGLPMLVCAACPTAIDVSAGVSVRLVTCRPRVEEAQPTARLAFFYFRVDDDPAQGGVWIPAFRALGTQKPGRGVGELLTDKVHYAPELIEAPLCAGVALDLTQARSRLHARPGSSGEGGCAASTVVLVSLGCRVRTGTLREPVTGWTWQADRLVPALEGLNLPAAVVSPSAACEAALQARRERAGERRRRTLEKIGKVFSGGR